MTALVLAAWPHHLAEACRTEIPVQPVLCFAGGGGQGSPQGVSGVIVCGPEALNGVILDRTNAPLPAADLGSVVACLQKLAG